MHGSKKQKDAALLRLIWEEVRIVRQEGTRLEVRHVKAHRSKKEKQEMSLFERFVTEVNERAEEPADGAMSDGGERVQMRASIVQREKAMRFTRHGRCSQVSLFGAGVAGL